MRSDVHHDDRLLTLFRLRGGLLRCRGLRFWRWLRLWSDGRLLNRLLHMLNGLLHMRLHRLLRRHGALRLLDRGLGVNGLMLRRLRCTDRLFRAHRWLLRLTLIRRLILVLRLTRCFMLPMNAIRRMTGPMNPDFTNAFNIVIKVVAFRLFIVA